MLLKFILVLALAVVSSLAEAPFNNRAPYAASGFRPSKPFNLPGEYLPPLEVEAEQRVPPNQGISFEITKQRVDFAGQEVQRAPVSEPQSQYLPPTQPGFVNTQGTSGTQPGFVNTQGTPDNRRPPFFGNRHGPRRHNGRPFQRPLQPPQTQPNFPPQAQPLPNPNTDERFETQQYFPKEQTQQPALEYGAPNNNIDPSYAGQQQQQQQQPALEYGAPINVDPRNFQDNDEEELEKQFALDALNAAVENYNRLQENNSDKIAQGQYFVVNPDHSIQKVKFTTKKSADEAKPNDFTAELKYTKVGELNDPLYKYTAEGQLERIVKK